MNEWNADMDVPSGVWKLQMMGDVPWVPAAFLALAVLVVLAVLPACAMLRKKHDAVKSDETCADAGESCRADVIVEALGGMDNIYSLASSDTRLRVTVNDDTLVNRMGLRSSGALGVLAKGRKVQVFYENHVERIYREIAKYIEGVNGGEAEEVKYDRVLKKVYAPVEGDVVRIPDIYSVQDMGDKTIGGCAVRAARGEIRAPFDCKTGYSKTGESQIDCISEDGYKVVIRLISEKNEVWKITRKAVDIHPVCGEGEYVRKGRLIAEYPYENMSDGKTLVYALIYVSLIHADGMCLKVNERENVNYEYVACEIVE